MVLRRAAIVLGLIPLSACFLSSETPRFEDGQTVLLLGDAPLTLESYERSDDGRWELSETSRLQVLPQASTYLVRPADAPASAGDSLPVSFLTLDDDHWLVQMVMPAATVPERTYYGVATWDGTELLLSMIECDGLRNRPDISRLVTFDGDNCDLRLARGGEAEALPKLLWANPSPPIFRFVRLP